MIVLPPRDCPGCGDAHPPLRTCAGGGNPWDGSPVEIERIGPAPAREDLHATEDEWIHAGEWAAEVVRRDSEGGALPYFVPAGESLTDAHRRGHLAEHIAGRVTGLPTYCRILSVRELRSGGKRPDLGKRTQVRNTRNPIGALRIYEPDPIDHLVLLITGRNRGPYNIRGWLEIEEARKVGTWKVDPKFPRGSSWHVEQRALRPLPLPAGA